ncbi:MAG: glycosyltransferase family 2 protein [Muribaculaceae bacterium]|nr:glycosyltransferase family 2 protein [Muribaculaceae bacterium]MDE6541225.1 glycosyltransferase family 2 protein [Muribaculaceae bacterium]
MNQTADYDFTIIVPVYNEEDNAAALEQRLSAFLPQCSRRACILFVDDGSRDRSRELIAGICSRHPDMFYISFASNCGLSAAIKAGFDAARSPLVGYIDADLQTAPEDFNLLLPHAVDHELVMGIRAARKDSAFKRLQSKIANGFRRMMTGDDALDTGCPLKVLHTDVARRVPMFTGMHRFLPALVGLQNGRVKQVPVRHFPRVAGTSKFSLSNRLVGPMMDCFAFRWMRPRWYNYRIGSTNLD